MRAAAWRPAAVAAWAVVALVGVAGCKRKHVPVTATPELAYPACPGELAADGGVPADYGVSVGSGHIRSGPLSNEKNVVERFDLRRTPCGYTLRSRQEWPLAISDVEVRYDADLRPLWAWKRLTIAGSKRADGNADVRRYELRTADVFIRRRDADGAVALEELLAGGKRAVPEGARVGAVIGPGRGVVTAWLKRAKLSVGQKTHELVLDFRSMVELLEMVALERNDDRFEPSLGKTVRVYTFYGQETVFADEDDVVVGDLAGMRSSDSLASPEPPPLPMYGAPDPVHTP